MRSLGDTRPSAPAFDPFGEPVAESVAHACASNGPSVVGDRRARRIGGAVFWSLALAILAGRVYVADLPAVQGIASSAAQMIALR